MTAQPDRISQLRPGQVIDDLFRKRSLVENIRRIVYGLRAPRTSGAYKYARLQLLRLQAPAAAVVVPVLILLLLLWLSSLRPTPVASHTFRYLSRSQPLPRLDHPVPVPPEPAKTEAEDPIPGLAGDDVSFRPEWPTHAPRSEISETVSPVRSPVIFRGLVPSTFPAQQAKALQEGGGTAQTEAAVMRTLRWMKSVQESDGSWVQESGNGPGRGTAPAMTALALLTFLAHHETTGSPEFGSSVLRGLQWLVANQEADGRFRGRDSHDYSHPMAAYALCEAYALMKIPMLREPARESLRVILAGQHPGGAWDYNCLQTVRDDTSYTGWCVQALRAAKSAQLEMDGLDDALRAAVRGLRSNANPRGGFGYTGTQPTPLTGVGVLCMQLLGASDTAEVKLGLRWLEAADCHWDRPWGTNPIYYWYYVTQAKFHARGETWERWNEQMKVTLVRHQTILKPARQGDPERGYWQACQASEHCKSYVYNTALCALMLQVYYRHLATFGEPEVLPTETFFTKAGEITVTAR